MFEFLNPKNWGAKKETGGSSGDGAAIFSSTLRFKNPNRREKLAAFRENDWVFGAVDFRGEVFADIKIKLFRINKDNEKVEIKNHKALDMLNRPNKFVTTFELLEVTSMHLDLVGEAFWLIDMVKREIWWLEPQKVSIISDPVKFITGYRYELDKGFREYTADEIVHFRKPNPANHYGASSALDACARTYNLDQNASEWNWQFFKQGAAANAILYFKQKFAKGIFKQFVQKFRDAHEGVENANKLAFLEHEVGKVDLDRTQKDMQFVELQDKTRDKLLGAGFRVSKALLGLDENSNRSTIDGAQYGFSVFVNRPRLNRFFAKLNGDYLNLFGEYFGQKLELSYEDRTPQDEELILKKRDSDLDHGVISINEAREAKGLKPVEGGEVPRTSATMIRIDEVSTLSDPAVSDKSVENSKKKEFKKLNRSKVLGAYLKRFTGHEKAISTRMRIYFSDQEKDILKALNKNSDRLKGFKAKAIEDDLLGVAKEQADDVFRKIFPLIILTAESEGQMAIAELGINEVFKIQKVRPVLVSQTQKFAKQVTATTFGLLKNELATGLGDGEGELELSNRVKKVFTNAKTYRAKAIARTETNTASNLAHKTAYDQLKVPQIEWVSAHDARTRPGHENADGQVVDRGEPFNVANASGETEKLDYPSDRVHGSAGNVINCRCRTIAHFKD